MKIEIEGGVPIPQKRKGRPEENLYPFGEMKIGDSFFIPDMPKTFSIYGMVRTYNQNNHDRPIRVTQRRESNGVRVWRIA